jgi:hypothetical protein
MSWLSSGLKKIGKVVKKGAKAVGKGFEKIDDFALPAIGFALGGPAGAALGSAAARGIGDGKFNAGATLLAGAKGYAGGALGSAAGLTGGQGLKVLGSSALKAAASPLTTAQGALGLGGGASAAPSLSVGATAPATAGATGAMGGLQKIGNAIGTVGKIAQPIIGGLSAYEGYQNDKKAQKLSDKQLALAEASYNERQPLRTLGRDLMLNQTPPDLSYIYANSSNPFAKRGS